MTRKASRFDRIRYAFDNTMSRGSLVLIGWLGLATILLVVAATALDIIIGGTSEVLGPVQVFWGVLMQALKPSFVDTKYPWQYLLVMLTMTLFSLIMVSILIGILNASIQIRILALRRGRSRVVESGHTVILGWSTTVTTIISELIQANESQAKSTVVVLGNKDKVHMEEEIRDKVGRSGRTRMVCRTGSPTSMVDLEIASLSTAKSIIIPSPENTRNPDAMVIQTLLAVINNPARRSESYHIVAVIRDPRNIDVARIVGRDEVELVLAGDVIARIMAQACRQSGLPVVISELLDFAGDEIYFKLEPRLVGKTFGEAMMSYEDSAVIGLQRGGGGPQLNPAADILIQDGDHIIVVSADDSTVVLSEKPDKVIDEASIREGKLLPQEADHTLLLGWNSLALNIIVQMESYLAPGSTLTVVSDFGDREAEIAKYRESGQTNLTVKFQQADTSDRRTLDALPFDTIDHVILLSYSDDLDLEEADARTIITLLHLRDIAGRIGRQFSIVSEMLDIRKRALVQVDFADDFVVSDRLISLMVAQIAENKSLGSVFADLLEPSGSEIYLKPAADYVQLGTPVSFYTVLESARRRGEVAFGYRLQANASSPAKAYGVVVNPGKAEFLTFNETDKIIVLD